MANRNQRQGVRSRRRGKEKVIEEEEEEENEPIKRDELGSFAKECLGNETVMAAICTCVGKMLYYSGLRWIHEKGDLEIGTETATFIKVKIENMLQKSMKVWKQELTESILKAIPGREPKTDKDKLKAVGDLHLVFRIVARVLLNWLVEIEARRWHGIRVMLRYCKFIAQDFDDLVKTRRPSKEKNLVGTMTFSNFAFSFMIYTARDFSPAIDPEFKSGNHLVKAIKEFCHSHGLTDEKTVELWIGDYAKQMIVVDEFAEWFKDERIGMPIMITLLKSIAEKCGDTFSSANQKKVIRLRSCPFGAFVEEREIIGKEQVQKNMENIDSVIRDTIESIKSNPDRQMKIEIIMKKFQMLKRSLSTWLYFVEKIETFIPNTIDWEKFSSPKCEPTAGASYNNMVLWDESLDPDHIVKVNNVGWFKDKFNQTLWEYIEKIPFDQWLCRDHFHSDSETFIRDFVYSFLCDEESLLHGFLDKGERPPTATTGSSASQHKKRTRMK